MIRPTFQRPALRLTDPYCWSVGARLGLALALAALLWLAVAWALGMPEGGSLE